ncbi:MAG: FAD-dependent oxidoreductase [Acidobacteriota bacterium]|jgi:2,4-dienoyl-CoA reductase-like NADH-dependent reductase (Old Yellow Enzyme family)/thioredoxin reductase|nr:FAD-dependent oxidoreductase [Acidobacteriota bacterium]
MEKGTNGLSRRGFLKTTGMAAGVLGVCATPVLADGGAAAGATPAAAAGDLLPIAYLNPQDYNYRSADSELKTLFSPLKLGSIQLSHRMVKSAAGSATYLKGPSEELLQYYVNFAKGGIEFIWLEDIGWLSARGPSPSPSATQVPVEEAKAFGKKLVGECARYGCSLGIQWGAFAFKPLAEITREELLRQEEAGVAAAKWYQDMGFKALEIHMTGAGLANSLLSRFTNTRKDEYGAGSLENRARFCVETIRKIKQACGKGFVIEALMECVQENDNLTNNVGEAFRWIDRDITLAHNKVNTVEEGIAFAKLFEAAGLDAVQCRLGMPSYHPAQFGSDLYFILNGLEGANAYGGWWNFKRHFQGQLIGNHSGAGMLLDISKRYKDALGIPVGAVTYMDPAHAPDFFEKALADGKVDYYLMTRPLTVDTGYVNKLKARKFDEIAPCTRCLHCHIGSNEANREMGYCRVNALTQRVMSGVPGTPDTYELPPLKGRPKKVMVVGGGPGGMEAARIAAARGHSVTLYEKSASLGGRLDFAAFIKGPHQNLADLKKYLVRQLEINKVDVVLDKTVDAAFVNAEKPDVLVLAVGGRYPDAPVAGNAGVKVIPYASFATAKMGENVVVYGGNAQAWDAALWLTVHKKNVQIVTETPNEGLDIQQSQHEMRMMTTALYTLGVKAWPGARIKSLGTGRITIATEYGTEVEIPCDAIVNAGDLLPNRSLLEGISVRETYAVGDCAKPYNIALAIRGGNDAGRAI